MTYPDKEMAFLHRPTKKEEREVNLSQYARRCNTTTVLCSTENRQVPDEPEDRQVTVPLVGQDEPTVSK